MATRTSSKVAAGVPSRGLRVGLIVEAAQYSLGTTSLSAGDVIQMVNIPKGARLVFAALSANSGQALVALGDGISAARYIAYGTAGSSDPGARFITLHAGNVPYVYSTDDTLDINISTVSVSTLTGGFHLQVIYSMDGG